MSLSGIYLNRTARATTVFFGLILLVFCAAIQTASAETIVRAFTSKETLQPGWIVAVDKDSPDTVNVAPADDPSKIYGVVIDPSRAPLTLQPQEGLRVYVATSGAYPVLVTTQNGAIEPGDFVSMSSTNGIAAKATTNQSYILGQALEEFDGNNNVITGGEGDSAIGRIMVTVLPGKNPLVDDRTAIPEPLKRAGEAIAGKTISPLRIYAALAIFMATTVITISILWVGIKSGMIAVGRNPLSRHSIIRGLSQIIIVAALVFVCGVFAVYLLLRL